MLFPGVLFAQQVSTIVNDPATRFRDDLIFDHMGNLYCADYGGNSVFKRTPNGTVTTFASGFNTPNGLAFDSQQNLFIADNVGDRIYKVDINGQFLDTITVTGPSGLIKMPTSDTLLFTQYPGNSLSKLAPDGTITPIYTGTPINGAVGLAWSPDGHLYLANFNNSQVFEVVFGATVTLDSLATLPLPNSGNAWLGFIEYASGYIWATAYSTNKIYKINPSNGQVTVVAGTVYGNTDGDASTAKFSNPNGIAANTTGDTLYVSDYGTGRLRMITGILLQMEEVRLPEWELYPNPATGKIYLSFRDNLLLDRMTLIDFSGRPVRTWDRPESGLSYSIEGITAGCYVLQISEGKNVYRKQLVIW